MPNLPTKKILKSFKVFMANRRNNWPNLTDESADKIAKAALENNLDYQKLFSKYYDKYKKTVGAITAAKIIQFENYMQTTVQAELQDAIPFVGEIEA